MVVKLEEIPDIVEKNINKANIYISTYWYGQIINENGFTKPNYFSAHIDKMFFDIDKENFFENTMRFHEFLEEKKILHRVNFSGHGFHVIVYIKPIEGINKKIILFNAMKYLDEKLKINAEKKTFGDIARIRRLENSFNFGAKRFCIPLDEESIKLNFEQIKERAKKPQYYIHYFGSKLLDVSKIGEFNGQDLNNYYTSFLSTQGILKINEIKIPRLIQAILEKEEKNFRDRFLILVFLKNVGVNKKDAILFLKDKLNKVRLHHNKWLESDFQHMMREKQVDDVYKKNYLFPSFETLRREGYCINKKEYEELEQIMEK